MVGEDRQCLLLALSRSHPALSRRERGNNGVHCIRKAHEVSAWRDPLGGLCGHCGASTVSLA